jgi:hypothetical protein
MVYGFSVWKCDSMRWNSSEASYWLPTLNPPTCASLTVLVSSPLSLHFTSTPPETRFSQPPFSLCMMSVYISVSLSRRASLFEQRRLSHAHALWTACLADTDAARRLNSSRLGYVSTITFRLLWNNYFVSSVSFSQAVKEQIFYYYHVLLLYLTFGKVSTLCLLYISFK